MIRSVLSRTIRLCLLAFGVALIPAVAAAEKESAGRCLAEFAATDSWALPAGASLGVGTATPASASWRCEWDDDCQSNQVCVDGRCRRDTEQCNVVCDWVCDEWVWEWTERCEKVFDALVCYQEQERICVSWRTENCRCA